MSTASAKKKIDRQIKICGEDRVVQHSWRPNGKGGYALTSVLLKKGTRTALKGALLDHVDEEEVAAVAARHAEEIRTRAEQKHRSGDATPAPRKRGNADLDIAATDPVEAELNSRSRGRGSGTQTLQQAKKARRARQSVRERGS